VAELLRKGPSIGATACRGRFRSSPVDEVAPHLGGPSRSQKGVPKIRRPVPHLALTAMFPVGQYQSLVMEEDECR